MITLGLVDSVDDNGVYVTMPGSKGVLRGPYATLQNVAAGDRVLVVTTDDGDTVIVGRISTDGQWTAYTPALTASTTDPTNWNKSGRYVLAGNLCHATFSLSASSTMTAGSGTYYIALPVPAATDSPFSILGTARLRDSDGAVNAIGLCQQSNTDSKVRIEYPATWPTGTQVLVGSAAPWTWANGDTIIGNATYEIA